MSRAASFGGTPTSCAKRLARCRREHPIASASASTRIRPPLARSSSQARLDVGRRRDGRPGEAAQQRLVEGGEAGPAVGRGVQALGQAGGVGPEQVLEPDGPLAQLAGGDAEQLADRDGLEVELHRPAEPSCRTRTGCGYSPPAKDPKRSPSTVHPSSRSTTTTTLRPAASSVSTGPSARWAKST